MDKNLMETSVPSEYTFKMKENGFIWVPDDTPAVVTSLFAAIAHFLSAKKRKDMSVGVKLTTTKGDFLVGASVAYVTNEEDEAMPGNWDFSMTFDEEEFKPEVELTCNDGAFVNVLLNVAERLYGMNFNSTHYVGQMINLIMQVLRTHLDINARTDEAVSVVIPQSCTVSVVVEGDRKIMSIVPDEALKQIVKDDSCNEII